MPGPPQLLLSFFCSEGDARRRAATGDHEAARRGAEIQALSRRSPRRSCGSTRPGNGLQTQPRCCRAIEALEPAGARSRSGLPPEWSSGTAPRGSRSQSDARAVRQPGPRRLAVAIWGPLVRIF